MDAWECVDGVLTLRVARKYIRVNREEKYIYDVVCVEGIVTRVVLL